MMSDAHAEPFFSGSFEDALSAAQCSSRPVLVDFFTSWCPPCNMLDETTWQDADVCTWLRNSVVALKIDAERQADLASRYKIDAYPTLLLLEPNGQEIDRLVGYLDPQGFLVEAQGALEGKDKVARAKDRLIGDQANNPMLRIAYAQALVAKQRHAEALAEYLWCFDHGLEHEPAFAGVRLSFLPSFVVKLGSSYAPALQALRQRRDAAREAILSGSEDTTRAMEFSGLNQALEEGAQTLALYETLRARPAVHVAVLNRLFEDSLDVLLDQRRYAEILGASGEMDQRWQQHVDNYDSISKSEQVNPDALESIRQYMVQDMSRFYEALLGANRDQEATALHNKMMGFDPSANSHACLAFRAGRARRLEVVQAILESAKQSLTPEEFKFVQESVQGL